MSENNPSIFTKIQDSLASLRLTMAVLIVLAIVSIIGTVIPQGDLKPEYVASIGGVQGNRYKLYSMLGFFNMYYSWWFVGLLSLLSANLLACSIKRLPNVWRIAFKPDGLLTGSIEKSAIACHRIPVDKAIPAEAIASKLSGYWGPPSESEHEGARHLFVQRRPWNRLAAYAVHASIIIIFAGAIIGNVFGFKGFMSIPEGSTVSTYMDRRGGERPLGFEIRCDQFTVSYYDMPGGGGPSQMPREFKSILTVTENGQEVPDYKHVRLIVNEPMTYKGITFYQSSYGQTGTYQFRVIDPDTGTGTVINLDGHSMVTLPDGSAMHVSEAVPDVSPYINGLHGPAAQIDYRGIDGTHKSFVSFAEHPELNRKNAEETGGMIINYLGGTQRPYTGLQVNKDPGVWVVWIGCILMCLALYAGFFMPHQRLWVRMDENEILVAGHSTRGQEAFRATIQELADSLETAPHKEVEKPC